MAFPVLTETVRAHEIFDIAMYNVDFADERRNRRDALPVRIKAVEITTADVATVSSPRPVEKCALARA